MVHCIAFGCSNNDADIKRGVSFFTVAIKKPDLLKQWLAKLRLEDPNVTKNSRVCPEHFSSDRFEPDLKAELLGTKAVRRLKPTAIPSIFCFTRTKQQRTTRRKKAHAAVSY
jgi:hypothetical protein